MKIFVLGHGHNTINIVRLYFSPRPRTVFPYPSLTTMRFAFGPSLPRFAESATIQTSKQSYRPGYIVFQYLGIPQSYAPSF